MQAQAHQPLRARAQAATLDRSAPLAEAGAIVLLVGFCVAFFAYLLARFPYDGLYGQDSYAYFYQARALLHEMQGIPPQPGELFGTEGLYHWPIGYHLHLALGLLFTPGPGGGRVITLAIAVAATALLYLLVGRLWPGAPLRSRVIAGVAAGLALPLVATYTRMALSIMADVPALFWSLLSVYCLLRAWPVDEAQEGRRRVAWAIAAGAALGIAVLIRYGAGLLMAPMGAYVVLRWWSGRRRGRAWGPSILWLAPGFIVALLPQAMYALTHHTAGAGYSDWLSAWNPANILSSNVVSADGASSYPQPMWVFYLLQPFYGTDQGFLSALYLPAILLGLFVLVRQRSIPVMGMLAVWWLVPALFLSGTPYQSQRFVLGYLPALLTLFGIGVATSVVWVASALRGVAVRYRWGLAVLAAVVLLVTTLGAYQEQNSTRAWAATQASFQSDEQAVVALARKAAGDASGQPPHVVSFGATAALYHYTGWPVLEFYNADEQAIAAFWQASGPRVLVLPEASMSTQWANTPLAVRWRWIQQHYTLKLQGTASVYTVYSVEGTR